MPTPDRHPRKPPGRLSWSRFYAPARLQFSAWIAGVLIGIVIGIVAGAGYSTVIYAFIAGGLAQFGSEAVWRRRAK